MSFINNNHKSEKNNYNNFRQASNYQSPYKINKDIFNLGNNGNLQKK